jgi:hypothetical protein
MQAGGARQQGREYTPETAGLLKVSQAVARVIAMYCIYIHVLLYIYDSHSRVPVCVLCERLWHPHGRSGFTTGTRQDGRALGLSGQSS